MPYGCIEAGGFVGILRLRRRPALRDSGFAQDDSSEGLSPMIAYWLSGRFANA